MLRTVVVPLELAGEDRLVLDFVAGLSSVGVKRALLTHALDTTGLEAPVIDAESGRAYRALLDEVPQVAEAGIATDAEVVSGDAKGGIVALAHREEADAVVCASHAKGSTDEILEGSLSEAFVHHAEVPSLVVRYDMLSATDGRRLGAELAREVVLATDFSEAAFHAFDLVTSLGPVIVGSLAILHVHDVEAEGGSGREAEDGAASALRDLVELARQRGVEAEAVVRFGAPSEVVLQELRQRSATLVVTGARNRSALQVAVVGSLPMTMLREAPCPALVVP